VTAAPEGDAVRWRPAALLLLAGAVVLFGVGVFIRSPVPILLAFPLLVAPVSAALYGPRGPPPVRVDGRVGGSGRRVEVDALLTPEAPVRPESLEVHFPLPAGITEVAPPRTSIEGRAQRVQLSWTAPDPTVTAVPSPEVLWRDPLGLVERRAQLAPSDLVVERYPPELHRVGAVRLRRTLALPGETRSRAVGASGEFFGIREAAPGDPPRRINWWASARFGRRLVNEYSLDRTGDLIVLIDTRPTGLGPAVDARLLTVSKAAAFGLAESFLRDKSRVGIGTYGEFLHVVPLATGRTQRLRLRNLLLATEVADLAGPAERCAVSLRRYFPSRTNTVLLSPLVGESQANLVAHIRRRGFPVVVLSPSYLPLYSAHGEGLAQDESLVLRFARLRRLGELAQVWKDAPVVDWEEYWSLGSFVDFLRRPVPQERGA
jgi:uncharacterized protein (DUF58 family)